MDAPPSLACGLRHSLGQRHDIVLRLSLDLVHPVCRDDPGVGDVGYGIVVFDANPSELAVGPY